MLPKCCPDFSSIFYITGSEYRLVAKWRKLRKPPSVIVDKIENRCHSRGFGCVYRVHSDQISKYHSPSPFKRSVSSRKQFQIIAGLRKTHHYVHCLHHPPQLVWNTLYLSVDKQSADMTQKAEVLEGNHKHVNKVRKLKANWWACNRTTHLHADWISFWNCNIEMYRDGERGMEKGKEKEKEKEMEKL